MTRSTLRPTLRCNNACIFCAQDGLPDAGAAPPDDDATETWFVGGEPTLAEDLVERVDAAHGRVGLQTNGRLLADPDYANALCDVGLTDVHLSIHGTSPRVHDYHTGVAGSFAAATEAAANLHARGVRIVVTSVVTRSNFRVLAGLPELLSRWSAAAWCVAWPRVAGRAADAFDRVVPRLGLALPFALHAARHAEFEVVISGAPLCGLGPFADRSIASDTLSHPEVCLSCPARPRCPGVDAGYLARFGDGELHPVDAPAAAEPSVAAAFVGVGAVALRSPPDMVSPISARASLPILGKAKPAAAESRGRSAKSGEELRTIFPDLFED